MKRIVALTLLIAGIFALPAAHATEWSTADYDLYPGDFDGDGKTDLLYVAKDRSKSSGIARSDGNGPNLTFQSWPSNYLGLTWHSNVYRPIVGDFNGDGKSDIFMQRSSGGYHYVLLADAEGKITSALAQIPNVHLGLTWSADTHNIIAGDFSGDGRSDLLLQAVAPGGVNAVVVADGSGLFTTGATQSWTDASWSAFNWSSKDSKLSVGDFNGDGKADLLIQAEPKFAMVDLDDLSIPMPIFAPGSFGVVYSMGGVAPFAFNSLTNVGRWNRNWQGANWSPDFTNVVVGNFDGNPGADILLQSRNGSASYLLSGLTGGAAFGAPSGLSSSVTWSGGRYRLIAGNFDGAGGVGVFFQATNAGGSNYYTNSVMGGVTLTDHSAASSTAPAPATAVGRTQGVANVGIKGDALYSIPLWTPPGTNGLTPNVSLEYSSQGANGPMGMGWSIPALSVIARCPRTIAQDGSATPEIGFNSNDKFCIDGSRLRLEGGGAYGAGGTLYRTEIESFRQIRIDSADSYGPVWFQVKAANGLTYEYGKSTSSLIRLVTGSGQLSQMRMYWALNRIVDRDGNYIDFTYTQELPNGGYYIDTISWSGNLNGTAPAYRMVFTNAAGFRPDAVWTEVPYTAGSSIARSLIRYRRLGKVEIFATAGNRLLRRYQLGYEASAEKTLLNSVQECGLDASACLAPTMISWQPPSTPSLPITTTTQATSTKLTVLDINGDGSDDLVWPASTWMYMLSNGNGSFNAAVNTDIPVGQQGAHILDFNGDGIQDLAVAHTGGRWWILPGGSAGFGAPIDTGMTALKGTFVDVNGDGRRDLVQTESVGSGVHLHNGVNFGSGNPTAGPEVCEILAPVGKRRQDFDADGKEDVVFQCKESDPDEGGEFDTTHIGYGDGATLRSSGGQMYQYFVFRGAGDFNSDAQLDYAYAVPNNVYVSNDQATSHAAVPNINWPMLVADWDNDGFDDILAANDANGAGNWSYYRRLNDSFAAAVALPISGAAAVRGDFDGDGTQDILTTNGSVVKVARRSATTPWASRDVIYSVTDGFGVSARFTYGAIGDPAVHTAIAGSGWPLMAVSSPRTLVRNLIQSDGSGGGGTYDQRFVYEGAREDLSRGFLGFSKRTVYDSRTPGLRSEQMYRQDFPFVGSVTSTYTKQHPSGTVVSGQINTWAALFYSSGYEARSYRYISQTVTDTHELGGTANGQKFSSVTTTVNAIDSVSGLATDVTSVTTEVGSTGVSSGATFTQRTYYPTISNDTANWCLGKPTSSETTRSHSLAGGGAVTRTKNMQWNSTKCRLANETLEPGSTKWQVFTEYGYDGFGNVNNVTITPAAGQGQAARTTTTYWGADGRFPRTVTNAKSQTTSYEWNTLFGSRTGATDPNSISEYSEYNDGFGRLTRSIASNGAKTDYQYNWCNTLSCRGSDGTRRMYVTAIQKDASAASAEIQRSYLYFDQFERKTQTYSQVLGGGYSSVRRTFDAFGRTWQESTPFLAGDSIWYTTYSYDDLGRVTQTTRPTSESDASAQMTTRAYVGLTVVGGDALGRNTTQKLNPLGQIVQTIDALGKDTDYEYDAFGNLRKVRDVANNEATVDYNVRGLKVSMSDPDLGSSTYDYYPLGELKSQTDAKAQTVSFEYDALSRLTKRTELEGVTNWYWDTQAKGIGQLGSVTSPGSYSEVYAYDTVGRLSRTTVTADGAAYDMDRSYNNAGQLLSLTYPQSTGAQRFAVRYSYQSGQMQSISDYTGGTVGATLWQANAVNARGQIIDEQLSNTLRTISGYDRIVGWLDYRTVGVAGSSQKLSLAYQYDKMGNLTQRQDQNQSVREDFSYDALDRLDKVTLNGGTTPTMDVDYDDAGIGNIKSKTGVGAFAYHATKKHAVASTTLGGVVTNYGYDANGNMSSRGGATIVWSSYNLPTQINQAGGNYSQFSYGADRSRYKHVANFGSFTETTISIQGIFERVTRGGVTEYRHSVMSATGAVMVRTRRTAGTLTEDYFLSRDNLGSVALTTSASMSNVVQTSFDAFGTRRNAATWSGVVPAADQTQIGNVGRRGYTDHEHLDNLSLIHMNGRVYDSSLGRFLSADPIVQATFAGQNLNRYSYVVNNPLKYTDPSGFRCGNVAVGVVEPEPTLPNEDYMQADAPPPPKIIYVGTGPTLCDAPPAIPQLPYISGFAVDWRDGGGSGGSGRSEGTREEAAPEKAVKPHRYRLRTWTSCSADEVLNTLKGEGSSAPGAPAITFEGVGPPIELWSFFSPNMIYQIVDTPNGTITNVALPGHEFLGQVETRVEPMGHGSVIDVVGTGVPGEERWRGALNNAAGYLLFGTRNLAIQKGCAASRGYAAPGTL